MNSETLKKMGDFLHNTLRLKTMPLSVKFLKQDDPLPQKTRQPSAVLGKRVTICQGVTMARVYGWTVGLTKKDLICVPAMIAFGFSGAGDPVASLAKLFCEVDFARDHATAEKEVASMSRLEKDEAQAIVLAPLSKGVIDPDVVALYGNPAQIMRLAQAWIFVNGGKIDAQIGGKVECSEYLLSPLKKQAPRVVIPGMGDRIFSMTQDDEMVFSLPGHALEGLIHGLKEAGRKIGARYPVTFYQNFQPEFPQPYMAMARELGIDFDQP